MSHQDESKNGESALLRSLLKSQLGASAALQNSEAMMAMERLRTVMGTPVMPRLGEIDAIVAGLQGSEVTKTIERLKAAMGTSAIRTLGELNPAIAALQNSEATRTMERLRAVMGTPLIPRLGEVSSMIAGLQNSEMTRTMERLRTVIGSSAIPRLGEISSMVAALQNSEVTKMIERMKAAAESQGLMLGPGVSVDAVATIAVALFNGTPAGVDESDESVLGKASEIGDEIDKARDFDELSESAKRVLIYIFNSVFLPTLLAYFFWLYTESVAAAKERMKELHCPQEVRSAIRSGAGTFDRSLLGGCRVVVGDRLNLRVSPSVKAEVIAELPVGAFLEVLDKSHRAWLLVKVEVDGELLQGWVFRRYTATFK